MTGKYFCCIDRCICEQEFDSFNKWCDYGYTVMESGHERLFHANSGVHERRLDWMTMSEKVILEKMAG